MANWTGRMIRIGKLIYKNTKNNHLAPPPPRCFGPWLVRNIQTGLNQPKNIDINCDSKSLPVNINITVNLSDLEDGTVSSREDITTITQHQQTGLNQPKNIIKSDSNLEDGNVSSQEDPQQTGPDQPKNIIKSDSDLEDHQQMGLNQSKNTIKSDSELEDGNVSSQEPQQTGLKLPKNIIKSDSDLEDGTVISREKRLIELSGEALSGLSPISNRLEKIMTVNQQAMSMEFSDIREVDKDLWNFFNKIRTKLHNINTEVKEVKEADEDGTVNSPEDITTVSQHQQTGPNQSKNIILEDGTVISREYRLIQNLGNVTCRILRISVRLGQITPLNGPDNAKDLADIHKDLLKLNTTIGASLFNNYELIEAEDDYFSSRRRRCGGK